MHEAAVRVAGYHDTGGRLLHKALDRRHEATIKRFNKAKDTHEVSLLWDEAKRRYSRSLLGVADALGGDR
jgi:hypothetical protein